MMPENPYLSVHIHRTGGNSLRAFFEKLYGPENVIIYNPGKGGLYKASDETNFRVTPPYLYIVKDILFQFSLGQKLYQILMKGRDKETNKPKIIPEELLDNQQFTVVHGHFKPDHLARSVPEAKLVTVLRDPLEQTLSHYRMLKQMSLRKVEFAESWFSPNMDFEEFAFNPEMTNFQRKFLNDFSLDQFAVVGVTDNLACYCRNFDSEAKVDVPRINRAFDRPISIGQDFTLEFEKRNHDDYELYRQALQRSI